MLLRFFDRHFGYGIDAGVDSNALEVQVHWLRKKLSADAIRTVRGVGYMVARDPK